MIHPEGLRSESYLIHKGTERGGYREKFFSHGF